MTFRDRLPSRDIIADSIEAVRTIYPVLDRRSKRLIRPAYYLDDRSPWYDEFKRRLLKST